MSYFEKVLQGARSMDIHFKTAPLHANLPVLLGMLGVWNLSFLGYKVRTTTTLFFFFFSFLFIYCIIAPLYMFSVFEYIVSHLSVSLS